MSRSGGNSRSSSRAGSRASHGSVSMSRMRSRGLGTRGNDSKYSSRPRALARGFSTPGCSNPYYSPVSPITPGLVQRASLDDPSRRRRAKRSGYDHPAATQSAPDLLCMPPTIYAEAKKADPCQPCYSPAGVESSRMGEVNRDSIEKQKKGFTPVYAPPSRSDPISHRDVEDETQFRDMTPTEGSAGIRSHRLTQIRTNWLSSDKGFTKSEYMKAANENFKRTDPISHIGGPPDPLTKGIRRYEFGRSDSTVPLNSNIDKPKKMKQGTALIKTRDVKTGIGEMMWHVAGEEDRIPAATQGLMKADLPPTKVHKRQNDRRMLQGFERSRDAGLRCPLLDESEDMYWCTKGETVGDGWLTPAMMATLNGGRRLSTTDVSKLSSLLSARDRLDERRPSLTRSGGAQTAREPTTRQLLRRQSDPALLRSARSPKITKGAAEVSNHNGYNADMVKL